MDAALPILDAKGTNDVQSCRFCFPTTCLLLLMQVLECYAKKYPVAVVFDGNATGGKAWQWLVTTEKITANNEFESPQPLVRVVEQTITGFHSGARLELPPLVSTSSR
jgi:hypothetical protein